MNKAILALDRVKAKLEAAERQKSEPIAIIGMACRFPGGGNTPEAFFNFLREGGDAISPVPADRWQLDVGEDAQSTPEGRGTRWGGFLREAVDGFDARFFGISPREAAHLDPQQRLLLEVGWEALERAGQDPTRLVGSSTGVFLGISTNDYLDLCEAAGPKGHDVYAVTGNGHAFAAGRVSFALGLQGPSVAVDTVCSSSLVAVHLACQSLRSGEGTLALVGGVNLMLSPDTARRTAATGALSPDGRCKTFDAGANGFVRSEGCGVVVLKLLSEALRDGDPILAQIRGSAMNQDGRSTGLTTPNVLSQQAMLRQALASARTTAEEIGYVETHGTGTSLGDPIEFEALRAVLGNPRSDGAECVLGAVKSNIGHLEAAAGIAGLIKAVMALREEVIPGNLHFRTLNPRISLQGTPFVIPTETRSWPRGGRPRLAGVSSFGMSGTNAHVVLEEPPVPEPVEVSPPASSSILLPLSAKSPEALRALAQSYAEVLAAKDGASLSDLAYTSSVRRAHHERRLAITGQTREEIGKALAAFVQNGANDGIVHGRAAISGRPRVVYVFSGQGSQWVAMGRQLLAEEPVFRAKLEQCSEILRRYVSWTLIDEIQAPEGQSRLAETKVAQPALFAMQVGLVKLLKSWGVRADAVIGHSVGEVAAAHVAGVLSLEEAARLVAWRGRIMQKATGSGKMVWVALPPEDAAHVIAARKDVVSIAAVNDPSSVVLSGEIAALDEVVAGLTRRGIQCRELRVNYAFHSPQMAPLASEFAVAIGRIQPHRAEIPLYSTVTGAMIDGEALHAAYWARNVREPVQFAQAVASAFGDGNRLFVEIGPHPVLTANLAQCFAAEKDPGITTFTMRRQSSGRRAMLDALGTLYVHGVDPNWKGVHQAEARCTPLPTYPWQRERYWVDVDPRALHAASEPQAAHGEDEAEARRDPASPLQVEPTSAPAAPSPRRWRGRSAAEMRPDLEALVRGTVAAVLGFADSGAIDTDRGFAELGLDSLMAVQLRNRLQAELGVPLSPTLAFDHPTADRLVSHLLSDVLDLEDRAAAPKAAAAVDEPIAIIGAACRFPGGAEDLDSYWRLLASGAEATTGVPASRWNAAEWYDPDPETPNRTYVTKGGFLRQVEAFDAGFFRISPREAMSLDPQQRLLLEVSWEALENAGQVPATLRESRTGVFFGASTNDYFERLRDLPDDRGGNYALTGTMLSVAAGRVSFFLGLHGPTVTVDTACSSSLVAMHDGCQSLRRGECDRALVGGVNLLLSPTVFVMLSRMRALAPDGRCKTFSAAADGYARAEGCGVVVLKRLRDAQRDGDRILALIRGTAINHDGASSGLTVPNGPAQQAVIRDALAQAGVAPADVDVVECHGTGTALGDPIEVHALGAVYGQGRPAERPLVLGSAKANLGHMEPAAGMGGLIKVLLALAHEQIPPQPQMGELNPHVSWEALPVAVAREAVPWRRGARPRLAGVSSFGMSGTNAHVVLEEAPASEPPPAAPVRPAELLVLSGKSPAALDAQAARLREHLEAHPEHGLGDIAFSLATTRSPMEHRMAVVVTSREGLQAALAAIRSGQLPPGVVRDTAATSRRRLAFMFTGQGAQEPGMGRALHAAWPAFRAAFDRCVALFDTALERPLREVMWADPGSAAAALLDQTSFTQPALFALEYALAALWRSWGVEPDLVAGHSIGELVAACVAGVFSLEDAVRLVAARGRLMQALPVGGAMVSVAAAEAEVSAAVAPHAASVSIAAVNGPAQVVIAGAEGSVQAIAAAFAARGVRVKALRVSHAFHSPLMEPMLEAFTRVAETVVYRRPSLALVSNVSGKLVSEEVCAPGYWVRHVREAVRFADGVQALHDAGANTFLEVGPKATLLGLIPACVPNVPATLIASVRAGRDERECVLEALGGLWAGGGGVAWSGVFPAGGRRVPLPTYGWQRERYWIEVPDAASRNRAGEATGHPLLGVRCPLAGSGAVFEVVVGLNSHPWLGDHRAGESVLMPGAALADLLWAAAAAHGVASSPRLTGVVFQTPLLLPDTGVRRIQVVLTETSDETVAAAVYSQLVEGETSAAWVLHVTATIAPEDAVRPGALDLAAARARCTEAMDVGAAYSTFSEAGLMYGPTFKGIRSLWRGDGESLAQVALPAGIAAEDYGVHPALLDAAGQSMMAASSAQQWGLMLPFAFGSVAIHQPGAEAAWVHTRFSGGGGAGVPVIADITLADADGEVIAEVTAVRLQRADREAFGSGDALADAFYRLAWREAPLPKALVELPHLSWVVVAPPGSAAGAALAGRLEGSALTEPAGLAATLAGLSSPVGVLCLWEAAANQDVSVEAQRVVAECLTVLRALGARLPIRLWWVTTGAVSVSSGDGVALATAPVWGLGRTVMQERPELDCKLVDLDLGTDVSSALLPELSASDGESQVAWRAGHRHVARLVRVKKTNEARPEEQVRAGKRPRVRSGGTVVLTGGLGALGRHVARWLVREGATHLLLTGRRGLDTPGAVEAAAEFEALGARVTVAAVDVADREALAAVLRAIPEDLPLRGVIHAAGVLDDGLLAEQTTERFRRVLEPKVTGAWNLHTLTIGHDLDFFVLFSSLSGLLGSPGQGNYTAANTFLDALAAYRRAQGLPAHSLAWGTWAGESGTGQQGSLAGIVAGLSTALQMRLSRQGIKALSPTQGTALLGQALARPEAQLGVASLDLRAVSRSLGAKVPSLWRALVRTPAVRHHATEAPERWAARLAGLSPEARTEEVRAAVRADIARVLSVSDVSDEQPLSELGLDSLMALELRNAVGQRVGATLPAAMAFDHPTLNALTRWLITDILAASEPEEAGETPPPGPVRESAAVGERIWQSSLSAFEETCTLERGRAARFALRKSEGARRSPALLLLHGAGANHHYFATLAEGLGRCDLLIPSLPGRCGSDGPPLGSASEAARWVQNLLAAVDVRPVVAVGHSYGGLIALELARMQAALPVEERLLRGLVLISTVPGTPVDPKLRDLLLGRAEAGPTDAGLFLLHHTIAGGVPEERLRDVARTLALTPKAASTSDLAASNEFAHTGGVAGVRLPTLMLFGSADQVAPVAHAHALEKQIPDSRLVVLEGVGHHPPLETPGALAAEILSFVNDLDGFLTHDEGSPRSSSSPAW